MYNTINETMEGAIIEYAAHHDLIDFWGDPIVEKISAQNKELGELKKSVSPKHMLPTDILPDAKSIIVYFIPFHKKIIDGNIGGEIASSEWASAFVKTNDLIKTVNGKIARLMCDGGYMAGKMLTAHSFDEETLISDWSHRHIAYIARLGTFGINNMLITATGCCGRFGSIVTNFEFDNYNAGAPAPEKCLNKIDGSCGLCRIRCVGNAFETGVYNSRKCYNKCLENAEYHKAVGYADVCGKCMVGLPCSTAEPRNVRNKEVHQSQLSLTCMI